jgi:DNA polymerase-3 subunit epsilon
MTRERLAFVDVETTGLGHGLHRIAEIGVVTVDCDRIWEWEALLHPGRRVESPPHEFGGEPGYFVADRATGLPSFRDIATDLATRLDGRLLIAHNARFDYAFIKAEFGRAGIAFAPQVLCTVMLSRKLYPKHARHDLDALIQRHGLEAGERHRALPDARALHGFWQALHREFPAEVIDAAIDALLREPLLPAHIDPDMIDALPERPGVFLLDAADGQLLRVGRAANLRRDLRHYFRLDRHCVRAGAIAGELSRIRWQAASGPLDARLRELALRRELRGAGPAWSQRPPVSIRIDPSSVPLATIVELAGPPPASGSLYGIFASERKAANCLRRIALAQCVCPRLLGLGAIGPCDCAGAPGRCAAVPAPQRARHLLRLMTGIAPLRLQPWPYPGPVAVREGRSVHLFDRWQHLGTVRAGSDLHALLQERRDVFDPGTYRLLTRALPRLKPGALRTIPAGMQAEAQADGCDDRQSTEPSIATKRSRSAPRAT